MFCELLGTKKKANAIAAEPITRAPTKKARYLIQKTIKQKLKTSSKLLEYHDILFIQNNTGIIGYACEVV